MSAPHSSKGIPVLMYHSISSSPSFFAVSPEMFERQMEMIASRGMHSVFASELPDVLAQDTENTVCITIDDGYRDAYEHAFPILKKYHLKASIFLITDLLGDAYESSSTGNTFPVLSENEIQEMLASGLVEFMPHTATHPNLDEISFEAAVKEIESSRAVVEALTGAPADIFAYPRGRYTEKIVGYLRTHQWRAAFGVKRGLATAADDLFFLPRLAIDSATSMRAFRAGLNGAIFTYRFLKILKARLGISF